MGEGVEVGGVDAAVAGFSGFDAAEGVGDGGGVAADGVGWDFAAGGGVAAAEGSAGALPVSGSRVSHHLLAGNASDV